MKNASDFVFTHSKVYIEYLDKERNFRQSTIFFDTYEDAVIWAKENLERFDPDMIKYLYPFRNTD